MAVRRAAVVWAASAIVACGLLALPIVAFAATSAVSIQNSAFAPTNTTIKVGDTVTWTNRDAFSHTATSDTGAWDTGVITAGASRSFTFTSAGTFAYHCTIHSFMKGTVVVQAVSTPQPTPPPPSTPRPTAAPTAVRTAPPTVAATAPPTVEPTEPPTPAPTTAAPSATASPTVAAAETPTASPSSSVVAAQLTPAPAPAAGPGPIIFAAAALAVVALGAIAFYLARRT